MYTRTDLIFLSGQATEEQDPQMNDPTGALKRKKRSISHSHYSDHIIKRRSVSTPDQTLNDVSQPTVSDITDEEATELCREAVRSSPAFDQCYQIFGESVFNSTISCIDDIKVRLIPRGSFQITDLTILYIIDLKNTLPAVRI